MRCPKLSVLLLMVGLVVGAHSQVVGKPSKGFFYKVTSPKGTAYLLGSIHIAPPSMYPVPKEIEDAFAASQVLNVEVDIRGAMGQGGPTGDQTEVLTKLLTSGTAMYADPDTLWNHVDKTTGHLLRLWCQKNGFPSVGMARMKPWIVSSLLLVLSGAAMGMDAAAGIDLHFLNEASTMHKTVGQISATDDKKQVGQIETMDSQIKLLSSVPEATQIADLKREVGQLGHINEGLQKLLDLWLTGDEKGADELSADISSDPATAKKFLDDRNVNMADFVESELKAGTSPFVVVGAAHIVGNKGILALLKKRGYTVSQPMVTWTHTVKMAAPKTPVT